MILTASWRVAIWASAVGASHAPLAADGADWDRRSEGADGWRPELAILGGLSLPTGNDAFSSGSVDPSFLVAFAHEYSLALGVGLTDRLGTFLELFGDRQTTDTAATRVSVDGGFTFLLTDIVQLDVYVGSGLRGRADDVFAGTGLSFRLPR